MGFALALIIIGILILMDRMGMGYGLREGWPWIIIALGIGGLFRNTKSLPAWLATIIGIFILGARYYSIHIRFPLVIKTYFLPVFLIVIGLLWMWKYKKD